jgi:hypothetical protein
MTTELAEEGKHEEAEAAFGRLATEGTAGYRMLARLRQTAEIAERPKAGDKRGADEHAEFNSCSVPAGRRGAACSG